MNRLLYFVVFCCLFCACSKDDEMNDPNAGKYLEGFIGSWSYEGHQVYPYGKQSVNTPSTLTINENGTFSFKGESMFIPDEIDSNLNPRIIDDKGTWSFDNTKGVLSFKKTTLDFQGNSCEGYFYYKILYSENGMTFSGYSVQKDWNWYFTKK